MNVSWHCSQCCTPKILIGKHVCVYLLQALFRQDGLPRALSLSVHHSPCVYYFSQLQNYRMHGIPINFTETVCTFGSGLSYVALCASYRVDFCASMRANGVFSSAILESLSALAQPVQCASARLFDTLCLWWRHYRTMCVRVFSLFPSLPSLRIQFLIFFIKHIKIIALFGPNC